MSLPAALTLASMVCMTWVVMSGSGLLLSATVGIMLAVLPWWYGPERQLESDVESKPGDITAVYLGFRCVADAVKQ